MSKRLPFLILFLLLLSPAFGGQTPPPSIMSATSSTEVVMEEVNDSHHNSPSRSRREKKERFWKRWMHNRLQKRLQKALTKEKSVEDCGTIYLQNGKTVAGNVVEIDTKNIRYRRCDNPDGPIYVVAKSDVEKVTFSDGRVFTFATDASNSVASNEPTYQASEGEIDKYAIASIVCLAGTLIISVLGPVLAIIFGAISLSRIKNRPWLRGRGLALGGLIGGVVLLLLATVLILALLAL